MRSGNEADRPADGGPPDADATRRATAEARLRVERARLTGQLQSLERSFADLVAAADVEPADDEHDPSGTTAYERAQVSSLAAIVRARLAELDRAISTVHDEGFGVCGACGAPIGAERLEALPATTTCIGCASAGTPPAGPSGRPDMTAEGGRVTDWVLHVDLDQFLVAVEALRRPELAGRPVVVGGDGDPTRARQVVATASYEARSFGVRSGMPLRQALRRCPDAIFLPSDRPAYEAASAEVMDALRSLEAPVEELGWDEAFVGVRTPSPEDFARRAQARVLERTRLSCAVGIGETKLQAKTATGFAKPGGVARLTHRAWLPTMGDRPVTALWGIGERTARGLADLHIHTVADLARADHHVLARHFGPRIGPSLRLLGLGGDRRPVVDEPHVPRGRSRETTFAHDLTDRAAIEDQVVRLATEVTESVVAEGRRVTHVAVKVRSATFFTRTRIRKLAEPTVDPGAVVAAALVVLGRFELDRPVRLLGVRVVLDLPT